eukprot:gnl/Dysnectes_brevis/5799_a8573_342.p1 GENE.gnl/Dysnectes_brevis/5799_a8573_342~~gnl/Dysnectes_brevis/5799_a8573_342.p1  ORF type:complete len:420 (+),score=104.82 gnl/Dysnectes_brevis/5799_a8573_342:27-1286(+)
MEPRSMDGGHHGHNLRLRIPTSSGTQSQSQTTSQTHRGDFALRRGSYFLAPLPYDCDSTPSKCQILAHRVNQSLGELEYFIHFLDPEVDKRLDRWLTAKDLLPLPEPQPLHTSPPPIPPQAVRNIHSVIYGAYSIEAWYFSPYPPTALAKAATEGGRVTLYVCDRCLRYMGRPATYQRHYPVCPCRHPPGRRVYQDGKIAIWEIDGRTSKLFCQCLCLLARLFLDHKVLFYDTSPFLFYVLTDTTGRVIGYFSKEKSNLRNMLACILTLPSHQRKGYGALLIRIAYLLASRDRRPGGPERPLSDLGLVSFQSYWDREVSRLLFSRGGEITMDGMVTETGIQKTDIQATMQRLLCDKDKDKQSATGAGGSKKRPAPKKLISLPLSAEQMALLVPFTERHPDPSDPLDVRGHVLDHACLTL